MERADLKAAQCSRQAYDDKGEESLRPQVGSHGGHTDVSGLIPSFPFASLRASRKQATAIYDQAKTAFHEIIAPERRSHRKLTPKVGHS